MSNSQSSGSVTALVLGPRPLRRWRCARCHQRAAAAPNRTYCRLAGPATMRLLLRGPERPRLLAAHLDNARHDKCISLADARHAAAGLLVAPALHVVDGRPQHDGVGSADASVLKQHAPRQDNCDTCARIGTTCHLMTKDLSATPPRISHRHAAHQCTKSGDRWPAVHVWG